MPRQKQRFVGRGVTGAAFAAVLLLAGGAGCNSASGVVSGAPAAEGATFDGDQAMQTLKRQVELGPRVPGTAAHDAAQKMLAEALGPRVQVQEFTHSSGGKSVPMANLIAQYGPAAGNRILLCAHWDCRPFADQDPNPANRNTPIPGANDGASGVAVLLELARVFQATPPPVGVTVALLDGEDWGHDVAEMFLGAKYFAQHQVGGPFRYGILLDMIGDSDLQIYREGNSQQRAPDVVDRVWRAASALGYDSFRNSVGYTILDDHLPLLEQGIPVIDVIDFSYPVWHTVEDTPAHCSARSLKIVGDVVRRVVYAEKP